MKDLLRIAVFAAGGTAKVASRYGVSRSAAGAWLSRGNFPADKVRDLCEAGGNVVQPEALARHLAESAARRAAATARARVLERAAA